jgi:hypothetical protein
MGASAHFDLMMSRTLVLTFSPSNQLAVIDIFLGSIRFLFAGEQSTIALELAHVISLVIDISRLS